MSHSYKHNPCCSDTRNKSNKKYANKAVRKFPYDQTLRYGNYKKVYQSYNICDYKWKYYSYKDYLNPRFGNGKDDFDSYQFYYRYYIRK